MMERDIETTHNLLEFAAADDLQAFKRAVEEHGCNPSKASAWYHRHYASHKMGWCQVTPAMIASLYGNLEVLKFTLSYIASNDGSVNIACSADKGTALHYAAAGSSPNALETVRVLLSYGADVNAVDAHGMRPFDVIMASPKQCYGKIEMERLLANAVADCVSPLSLHFASKHPVGKSLDDVWNLQSTDDDNDPMHYVHSVSSLTSTNVSSFPPLLSSLSFPISSQVSTTSQESLEKTREYPVEPTFSDVKNSLYTSDDFRMFSFKVRPCSRAYSHDWTECPFVHIGENARRRDPRKFHYSCVPCPDFRKGACRFGDACEYAHGIFESWLHPAQYRTRLCKDGVDCTRRVCFFAHTKDELRPLYISSGSAIPSPRGPSSCDVSATFGPASPSSFNNAAASSFSPSQTSHQMSNTIPSMSANSLKGPWIPPSTPTVHIPGNGGLHSSWLRAALSARDACYEDWGRESSFETQGDGAFLSSQTGYNILDPTAKYDGINLSPTNFENAYTMEGVSPPSSPIRKLMQSHMGTHAQPSRSCSLLKSQLNPRTQVLSPSGSPMQCATVSCLQLEEDAYMQSPTQTFCNVGSTKDTFSIENEVISRTNGKKPVSCPITGWGISRSRGFSLSDWGSPTGKLEWGVQKEDLHRLRSSSSFGLNTYMEGASLCAASINMCTKEVGCNVSNDEPDSVLGFWLEQMQLDEITA